MRAQLEQRHIFSGHTPFHSAVTTANEELLKCILLEEVDINAKGLGQTPLTLAIGRNSWKSFLICMKTDERQDLRTQAWIQCSHQDGWLKWQERTKRIVTLLKVHGATESSRQDFLTELEKPVEMGSLFRDIGISDDSLEKMVADLESANKAEGVTIEGGLVVSEAVINSNAPFRLRRTPLPKRRL